MTQESNFPKNVAIIMDGNGRWAKERGLKRTEGHRQGIESVDAIVTAAAELHLESLVLYAFSSENWKRPKAEISVLMNYLSQYLDEKLPKMQKENIRFHAIGRLSDLPKDVIAKIERNSKETNKNTGLNLVLALSYGSRNEIVDAARAIAADARDGKLDPDAIDEAVFKKYLYMPELPDPDLLIRTSGELRVSNFLLWQISYAELYITEKYWPDFRKQDFLEALQDFEKRTRRFGK